jgi:hypothetical protein
MSAERDQLPFLAAAAVMVAAADAAVALRSDSAPTGFGDGAAYRAMARGEPGAPPFNRRVLMPTLVRALTSGDPLTGFRLVALSAIAVAALEAGLLSARVARSCGATRGRSWAAGSLVAGLVPAMPHSTRLAVQIPTFNDQLAIAAGALWVLLANSTRRAPLAPLAAAAAVLTREQWAVVIGAALPALPSAQSDGVLVAHVVAVALAVAVVLAQPAGPGSEVYSPALALRRLITPEGAGEVAWGLLWSSGLLPALLPAALRRVAEQPHDRGLLKALLRVGAVQACLATVGGSDTPRLAYGGVPFLAAATVGVAAADRDPRLTPVITGSLALWRPLARLTGTARGYEEFFLPYMHSPPARRVAADVVRAMAGIALARAAWRWFIARRLRHHLVVDGDGLGHGSGDVELEPRQAGRAPGKIRSSLRVSRERPERSGEGKRVLRRNEDHGVTNSRRDLADCRRHAGKAGHHGLQERQREGVRPRG